MDIEADDLEKFDFYLNSGFGFFKTILLSNVVRKPEEKELNRMILELGKKEVECFYNHFHMSAITNDITQQKKYAEELWSRWRLFFSQKMPEKQVAIEICDLEIEIIMYVYEV